MIASHKLWWTDWYVIRYVEALFQSSSDTVLLVTRNLDTQMKGLYIVSVSSWLIDI